MRARVFGWSLLFVLALGQLTGVLAADQKIEALKKAPTGLSVELAAAVSDSGFRITENNKVICDMWLAKEIPLKPKFKPSLRVKYPFQTGQLIGVIHFPEGSNPNDFRGQSLKPGTYTLRYGLQPDDGNHLGTSDIRDFLVGCPPKTDTSPKRIEDIQDLFKLSASAASGTHPAIFLLLPPPEKPYDAAVVTHDDEKNLLIFEANANGKAGDKTVSVPLRVVTLGKTEG